MNSNTQVKAMPPDTATHGLQAFYRGLVTLKNDRTTYIRASDVLANYEQLGHALRSHQELYGSSSSSSSNSDEQQGELLSNQLECEPPLVASGWDVC